PALSASEATAPVVPSRAGVVWAWRGRSRAARWWATRNLSSDWGLGPHAAMGALPMFGFAAFGVGIYQLFGERVIAVSVVCYLLFFVSALGLAFPRLWAPRWYKDWHRTHKRQGRAS